MKRLLKIKLINWHYFENETIQIKGHTLITGENGSGKSTILDAIQYVLTCGKQKFNHAANEKASRDLIGYVRCKTGQDSQQFERRGDVTSHLALEFHDDDKKNHFIIGAVVDSSGDLSTPKSIFYRIENKQITDDLFILNRKPRKINHFNVYVKDMQAKVFSTQEEARSDIRNRFGALNPRFFDLLPKALAFRPINNVKDFVYSYLLDKKEINIDYLKENIRTLTEFEKYLKKIKEKIERLEMLDKYYQELQIVMENLKIQEYIVFRSKQDINLFKIKTKEKEIEDNKSVLLIKGNEQKDKKAKLEKEKDYLQELEKSLEHNNHYQLLKKLEREKDSLKKEIEELKEKEDRFDSKLAQIFDLIFGMHKHQISIIGMEDLYQFKNIDISKDNITTFLDAVTTFHRALRDYLDRLREDKAKIKIKIQGYTDELETINQEIKRLESKQLIFPDYVLRLKQAIIQEMKKIHGLEINPRILCELLEVKDPKWQNAVEGYLNTQRFNLLIEPQYFDAAVEIYENVKMRSHIHSIGLINTQNLQETKDENENSLAYMVTSENHYAKLYVNLLLNHVVRCETIKTLKNYPRSITPSCMVYQNHTVRHINPSIYQTPYIGFEAYKKQLELKIKQKVEVEEKIKSFRSELKEKESMIKQIESVDLNFIRENSTIKINLRTLNEQLISVDQKLAEIDQSSFIELQISIQAIKNNIKKLKDSVGILDDEIIHLKAKLEYNEKVLLELQDVQINLNDRMICLENDILSILNKAIERYQNAIRDKDLETVKDNYERQKQGTATRYEKVLNTLKMSQRDYNKDYHFSAVLGTEGMNEYYDELKVLRDSKMVEYEEKIRQSKKKAEEQFQDEFLSKLQENILNAQRELDKINDALKGIVFGDDEYRFIYKSDQKNKIFYDMIMDDSNIGGNSLFSSSFREKHKEALDNLFEQISLDDDLSKKALETYTDYRTYMDYDIKIMHRSGNTSSFSKVCREKSGGETQTPYYVAIIASFLQLYDSNHFSDSIGLILFDEAFDKMDENRIESMMSFINKLDLQTILAAPPQKIETISPYVKTNLVVNREGSIAFVEEFHYEKIQ